MRLDISICIKVTNRLYFESKKESKMNQNMNIRNDIQNNVDNYYAV